MNEKRDLEVAVKRTVQSTVNIQAFMDGILDLIIREKQLSYDEGYKAAKGPKTVCSKGHLLEGENLMQKGKYQVCRTCHVQYTKDYRARQKAAKNDGQN